MNDKINKTIIVIQELKFCKIAPKSLKLNISSHSKPRTMSRTRLLKCFVLIALCCETKHMRSLIGGTLQGLEWLKILGFRLRQDQICIQQHCFSKYKDRFRLTSKLQKWYSLHSGRVTPSFIYSWLINTFWNPKSSVWAAQGSKEKCVINLCLFKLLFHKIIVGSLLKSSLT